MPRSPHAPLPAFLPASLTADLRLIGVDFTSAPSRRKPITLARGRFGAAALELETIDELADFPAFEAALARPGPWVGGFDFPFGLPRGFVDGLGLGGTAAAVIAAVHRRATSRMAWRACIDAWGQHRPAGQRLIHRRTDVAMNGTRSTSPLQTRYVPVGFMYYEGLPRLLRAGLSLPGLHAGDGQRVALEAYPGLLAHELLGRRSYKNGDSADHRQARRELLQALREGRTRLGMPVRWDASWDTRLAGDTSGDRLDALLCLVQAAWAATQPGWGLPAEVDPVEGWIVSAGAA